MKPAFQHLKYSSVDFFIKSKNKYLERYILIMR